MPYPNALITDAVSECGYVHGCHRVQEASGESSEAAVTEPGIGLRFLHLLKMTTTRGECVTNRCIKLQRFGRVGERTPDQKFHR